jgi:prepilin-type processing-associated H-X9-DG protein/prepilin-type N-terminal cleavage/methylation domain-containing protein
LHKAGAFTLSELLVVIAIIAVLSGLSLAAMSSIRTNADIAESVSHLRQWGAALGLYAAENDGYIPRRGQGVQPLGQITRPTDWFNALPPYLGSPSYQDLVNSGHKPKAGDKSIFVSPGSTDPGGQYFLSYGMNMNLSPWNLPDPTRLSQIENLPFVVFMAEAPGPYSSTYPSTKAYCVATPHRRMGNVLFLDGHVQTLSASYLGCGVGDPKRADVSWLTGTASDSQASTY